MQGRLGSIGIVLITIAAVLAAACSHAGNGGGEDEPREVIGGVLPGIDVPEPVLHAARTKVDEYFRRDADEYPHYGYESWRIEALQYVYTYGDISSLPIEIYQMNYEFFSSSPDKITLAGGMYITEDGWVMPSYPNSYFLIFEVDGGSRTFIDIIMVNDSYPGEPLFTEDLERVLDAPDEGSPQNERPGA